MNSSESAQAPSRLHQPWRGLFALVELILAAGLVYVAVWMWNAGLDDVRIEERALSFTGQRYVGSWLTTAAAIVAVAGIAVLDAFRQLVLALRVRSRDRSEGQDGHPDADEWPPARIEA